MSAAFYSKLYKPFTKYNSWLCCKRESKANHFKWVGNYVCRCLNLTYIHYFHWCSKDVISLKEGNGMWRVHYIWQSNKLRKKWQKMYRWTTHPTHCINYHEHLLCQLMHMSWIILHRLHTLFGGNNDLSWRNGTNCQNYRKSLIFSIIMLTSRRPTQAYICLPFLQFFLR